MWNNQNSCKNKTFIQYTIQDIEPFDIVPGFHARMIHTDALTIAFVDIDAGATLPEHAHIHEQITSMLEGELEMTIRSTTRRFSAGQSVVIPSNVPHAGRAITACKFMVR